MANPLPNPSPGGDRTRAASTPAADLLLVTKLRAPPLRPGLVARRPLLARLSAASRQRLTLLTAPAGAGKTTLLSAWAAEQQPPSAWLSLEAADDEPTSFWTYTVAALNLAYPRVGEDAMALLRSPSPVPLTTVLTVLLNRLAAVEHPVVLIVDDFHLITSTAIHQQLSWVLDHAPPALHLILGGRRWPDLPLARLRARAQVAELDAAALSFSATEAAALFQQAFGLALPAAVVTALTDRTAGWAVGLQLAGLALQGRAEPAATVAALSHDRNLRNYLLSEVLDHQPPALRAFMLDTIGLDRLSGPLSDAVTGRTDGADLLERLVVANLFLTALDAEGRWYRYHPLVAEVLRQHLQQTEPARLVLCHQRATAWYLRHELVAEAIDQALAAGDHELALDCLEMAADRLMQQVAAGALLRWIERLPAERVRRRARLCVAVGWALLATGQFAAVEGWAAAAEVALGLNAATATGDLSPEHRTLLAHLDTLRATVAVNGRDSERTIQLARRALAWLPPADELLRAMIAHNLGDAYLQRGESVAAASAFTEAISTSRSGAVAIITISAGGSLGELQANQGQLRQAAATLRVAIAAATTPDGSIRPWAGKPQVWLAGLLYEWDALAEAQALITTAIERCVAWGHLGHHLDGLLLLATIQAAGGEWAAATATLDDAAARLAAAARPAGDQSPVLSPEQRVWLSERLAAQRLTLWLAQGDLATAVSWGPRHCPTADRSEQPTLVAAHARLLIAQGRPDLALRRLTQPLAVAAGQGQQRRLIGLLAVQALAYAAASRPGPALAALTRALTLAEPEGYARTFLDLGAPLLALLHQALAQGVTPAYTQRLLAAGESQRGPALVAAAVPLSERELAVLRLLAAGRSNPEIAAALFVSVNTVKTHLRRLFAKLDARSRLEALAAARRAGWL